MIEYYLYFFLLWFFAFLEFFTERRNAYWFSLTIFSLFLILRFDTGYDWPEYKRIFDSISEGVNYVEIMYISIDAGKEFGFVYFLSVLKLISKDFQIVILVVSIIEIYALHKFLKLTSNYPAMVLAIVGTWLLFTLYFSVLRQGLAVSFFLLFWIFMQKKNYLRAILMILFSLSMQISSIAYYVLYYFSAFKPKKNLLLFIFITTFILGNFSQQITYTLFTILQNAGIPIISEKATWYMQGIQTGANLYDKFYVYIYSIVMFCFLYITWDSYKTLLWIRISFFAMVFILIQLLFIDYPLIRNRIQYVAFMMQFILFINYFYNKQVFIKFIIFTVLLITVLAYYSLMLNRTTNIVFRPYQDYIRYNLFDFENTGLNRQEQMYEYMAR